MPLSPALAAWLVEQGQDCVHVADLGLDRASDSEILQRARDDGRVMITADLDYARLLVQARSHKPGLILFRRGNYSEREARERLQRVLDVVPQEELHTSIVVIERGRIRRRRLPLEPDV